MIDTHAHISLGGDVKIEGLEWVVLSASNIFDSKENLELAKSNRKLRSAIGIHPQELITNYELLITNLEELLRYDKCIIAVGECGMDFSDDYDKEIQEKIFRGQIELADKYNKPLIVHSREAAEDTIRILSDYENLKGVIHCYTGGKKRIRRYLELKSEFYFGIDGNITYEDGLIEVVKLIPRDRLVLETDSPFLTPIPFRGDINYPQNVKYVYQKVSEIWELSFEETERIIDENAKRLFGTK